MNFEKEINEILAKDCKNELHNYLNKVLLKAYNLGWNDCITGDDIPSFDAQTNQQIIERIKTEAPLTEKISPYYRVGPSFGFSFPDGLQQKYQKAIRFAGERHLDQKLPGSNVSYLVHVSNVAMEILLAYQAHPDFDVEFAVQLALLHDVIEDTETSYTELGDAFDKRIADAVLALSKDKRIDVKTERMKDSLERILRLEKEVGMVKLADRITNLQPPPLHWSTEKITKYGAEAQLIFETLKNCNVYLARRLRVKLGEY
jgi:(p)ppGpp synthase/HD superfamily hydrolase